MATIVNTLDDGQLKALAAYFGSLKPESDAAKAALLKAFKWSPEIIKLASSGDATKGQALANEIGCSGCHGEQGRSEDPSMPNLAGQGAAYILKQLYDFKQGGRTSEFMAEPVKMLTMAKMVDLAAWYSSRKLGSARGGAKGGIAEILALKGDKPRLLIGCNICHGKDGVGLSVEVPALRGQKRDYLVNTLMKFKSGERRNDHYSRMGFVASILTKREIELLAEYYAEVRQPEAVAVVSQDMVQARAANTSGKKAWGKCKGCHTVKKGGRNKSGPNLFGIVGKPAGSAAKYRYSRKLKQKAGEGLVWTEEALDGWLKNPGKFIGGRSKMSRKTRSANERAAVISYLGEFK